MMSKCKHIIFKKGRLVKVEVLPDKGLSYEDKMGAAQSDKQDKAKKDIWEVRRQMSTFCTH